MPVKILNVLPGTVLNNIEGDISGNAKRFQ